MFDPTIYDRRIVKVNQTSCWYQCAFELPEVLKERMPQKHWERSNGKHTIELDAPPLPGYEFLYPPIDQACPSFYWQVVKVRQFPRRFKSHQPKIVSQVFVKFGGEIDD